MSGQKSNIVCSMLVWNTKDEWCCHGQPSMQVFDDDTTCGNAERKKQSICCVVFVVLGVILSVV